MTIWVIERVVHLLHPLMPYITETLWKHIAGDNAGMLITAPWPEARLAADQEAVAEMEWVVSLISAIRGDALGDERAGGERARRDDHRNPSRGARLDRDPWRADPPSRTAEEHRHRRERPMPRPHCRSWSRARRC